VNRWLAPIVAMTLSVAGCGSGTATSPTPAVVSPVGSWSGSITDAIAGDGSMQLALSEQSAGALNSLAGTWTATFKNGESFSGPAVGGLYLPNGYGIMLYVGQPLPPCLTESGPGGSALVGFTLINVVATSSRLTAVAGRLSCSGGPAFGSVSLSKQ
jgi:hypothetical protein